MATIKPFKGVLPVAQKVKEVATLPYDVVNTKEARELAAGNPNSFFHVIRPEIDFSDDVDPYSDKVYQKGKENFDTMMSNGVLNQDSKEYLYIYELIATDKRSQNGIVACASVEDYFNNVIKKHELTRPDKENDRKRHVLDLNMNAEPVFFAYPTNASLKSIVEKVKRQKALFDFVAEDGIQHRFWRVESEDMIEEICTIFRTFDSTYIADGHHRTAAAALAGRELKEKDRNPTSDNEYNYFLAVHFPEDELEIIDYNRVVKDLNGQDQNTFLENLKKYFDISKLEHQPEKPIKKFDYGMYMNGQWYLLTAKSHTYNLNDPIDGLDVTVLTKSILSPILGISDLRTDKRISFVGGVRGLSELERLVDSNAYKVAFALHPVSMKELIDIADNNMIMPPKTTWFEPKLRSGIVSHLLD